MSTLLVKTILPERILVSRESARQLREALLAMVAAAPRDVAVLDFDGISGVAPSFLDELLTVFESIVRSETVGPAALIVAHPPTRLSSKFEAVARGHGMTARPREDGSWLLNRAA